MNLLYAQAAFDKCRSRVRHFAGASEIPVLSQCSVMDCSHAFWFLPRVSLCPCKQRICIKCSPNNLRAGSDFLGLFLVKTKANTQFFAPRGAAPHPARAQRPGPMKLSARFSISCRSGVLIHSLTPCAPSTLGSASKTSNTLRRT